MKKVILIYGVVCYVMFLCVFLYIAGFLANLWVPKSIDSGESGELISSVIINVLLLSIFAVQHTIMARPAFKEWWTRYVPKPAERSTYVLFTNVALIIIMWQWRPLTDLVWDVSGTSALNIGLWGLCAVGWLTVLYSTFLINHFDLFGLRQVWLFWNDREYTDPPFAKPWLYQQVRNPLMLGFVIAIWTTPTMSQGHLVFALVTLGYIFFGIHMEEHDLKKALGEEYIEYHSRTPMLIPFLRFGKGEQAEVKEDTGE